MATRLLVFLTALSGCADRPVAPPGPVARIVSLTPSSTEIVTAAGGLSRLVAVDRYSAYPPEVAGLPRVGDFLDPRVEAIVALRPDLVVLDEVQRRTAERLEAAGLATLVLDVHRIEDVRAGLARVGDALGTRAEADRAIAAIDAAVAAARQRAATRSRRPRVLAIVDRAPGELHGLVAAGPGSYLDELLALLGAGNVLEGGAVRYPKLAGDRVIEAAPEVVLDASHSADPVRAVADWRALARVPAVATGRVHALPEPYYLAPSPRVPAALAGLERLLFP